MDISIGQAHADLLKESFEGLKTDLLSTIERKVEDKVTAILQKASGSDDQEDKVSVSPIRRYVDIRLDGTEDDDTTPYPYVLKHSGLTL